MKDRETEAEEARRMLASLSGDAGPPDDDPVEIWARRIGRALGFVLLLLLAVNLFTGWFF